VLALCLALSPAVVPPSTARAQPGSAGDRAPSLADKETARALFRLGDDKYQAGDYAGALEAFEAADEIMNVPTTKLERARTLMRLDRLLEAHDMLRRVQSMPVGPDESPAFEAARVEAQSLTSEVAARIPSLRVNIRGLPEGVDFELRVDDAFIPPKAARFPRRVDPGEHLVVVIAEGYAVQRRRIVVAQRDSAEVTIDMESDAEVAESEAGLMPWWGWVGFGVGAAGLITGGVTGGITLARVSDLDDQCPDRRCPATVQEDLDDAEVVSHVSTVGFVVGGVGVAVGVLGLILDDDGSDEAELVVITPCVGPGSVGLRGRF